MDRKLLIVLIALVALVGVALIFMWQGQNKINKTLALLTGGAPIEDADAEVMDSKVNESKDEQEYEQEQQEEEQVEEQTEQEEPERVDESNSVLQGGEEEQNENEQEQVEQEQDINMKQVAGNMEQVTGDLKHEEQNTVQPVVTENKVTEPLNTKPAPSETRPVRKRVRRTKAQIEEDREMGIVKGKAQKKTVNVSENGNMGKQFGDFSSRSDESLVRKPEELKSTEQNSEKKVSNDTPVKGAELMIETVVENKDSAEAVVRELPVINTEQKLTPEEATSKVGKYKKMQKTLTETMNRTNVDEDEGSGESEDNKL